MHVLGPIILAHFVDTIKYRVKVCMHSMSGAWSTNISSMATNMIGY